MKMIASIIIIFSILVTHFSCAMSEEHVEYIRNPQLEGVKEPEPLPSAVQAGQQMVKNQEHAFEAAFEAMMRCMHEIKTDTRGNIAIGNWARPELNEDDLKNIRNHNDFFEQFSRFLNKELTESKLLTKEQKERLEKASDELEKELKNFKKVKLS